MRIEARSVGHRRGKPLLIRGFQEPSSLETMRRDLTLAGLERTFGFRESGRQFSERFEDVLVRRV